MNSEIDKRTKKLDTIFYIFFYSIIEWLILSVQFSYKDENFLVFILFLLVFSLFLNEIYKKANELFNNSKKVKFFLITIHLTVIVLSYFIGYLKVELTKFIF